MSELENRIERLEGSLGGQGTMREPYDLDELIRKLGFDPVVVRAKAIENEQSIAWVVAGELGMSPGDFQKALKQGARGEGAS